MEKIVLEAQIRDPKISSLYLRKNRKIPAIYYGHKQENLTLELDYQTFRKAYIKAGGNQIIQLQVQGKTRPVLIHDVQFNPLRDTFDHVDFLHVNMNEEITANIPIEITGVAPAVKDLGGILTTLKDEIEVTCLPANLPPVITVDISGLAELHSSIFVKDLAVPKDVKITENPDDAVVTVTVVQEETEPVVQEGVTAEGIPIEQTTEAADQGSAEKKE